MAWRLPAFWFALLLAGLPISLPPAEPEPPQGLADLIHAQDSDDEDEESDDENVAARRPLTRRSSPGPRGGGAPRIFQKIIKTPNGRTALYGFENFNRDKVELSFTIGETTFQKYNDSFGYRREGLDEAKDFRDNALKSSYQIAVKRGLSQAQVDAAAANIEKEYKKRVRDYLAAQGFRFITDTLVGVDMPALVRKNGPLVKELAHSLDKQARARKYGSHEIIGAGLSFVQTAMHYKQPDVIYKGKHTGGVLPPLTAVVVGWGDCDTKTGLLASLMSNWAQMRMIGVSIPKHYLMGVLLIPEKGDLYLEYQGLQYVLLETAGPAWLPPGRVADTTIAMLNSREGYKLEPFY